MCSVKTDYRTDYRFMLEYIADKCSDLLFQIDSPVIQNFEVSYEKNGDLIYQRFSFVKAYISSDEFKEAVQSIIKSPTTCWEEEYISTPSSRLSKIGRSESRQIVASSKRLSLCSSHPLYRSGAFSSFPSHIKTKHKRESVDTNENRFVKYVLENLLQFFESCVELFSVYPQSLKEAKYLRDLLAQFLSHNFFKQVGKLTIAHFNSPILQRKYAYKTVLNMWLKFELTSQLTWSGGDDVYQAGKRDVAQLYEYWVFFVLLEIISKHFDIPIQEYESLFNMNNGLSLSLKQGKTTALNGTYNSGSRQFNICLYYNRSFSGGNSFPDAGSWTINMRPDYTLSIWPIELSEKEAEVQEEMVHIHFDAKYKIANAYDLFKADLDLDKEYTENKKGIYKQIDLIKMHAYKDAIRRSEGAYIIYPGDEPKSLKGFHEIIPGLGAFPLKPSLRGEGYSELAVFIESVIQHLKNRASQREHKAYHTYHIYKDSEDKIGRAHV